ILIARHARPCAGHPRPGIRAGKTRMAGKSSAKTRFALLPGHDGNRKPPFFEDLKMKLTFSPASPFARKVRIAAIELGLIDKIEFISATVVPGQRNDEYSKINPVKKLPALILDNGEV